MRSICLFNFFIGTQLNKLFFYEMTKRHYPFEEYHPGRQMKVHVGVKEVDRGVANVSRMSLVYDKTMAMLFGRTHQLSDRSNQNSAVTSANTDNLLASVVGDNLPTAKSEQFGNNSSSKGQRRFKQMHLNPHGQLSEHGKDLTAPTMSMALPGRCSSCEGVVNQSCCTFCERQLCDKCLSHCDECSQTFCPLCSVKMYGAKDDVSVCLTCLCHRM